MSKYSNSSIKLKLVEIQRPQTFYEIEAKWHNSIKDIKDMLRHRTHLSKLVILLPNSPCQLRNSVTLHDLALDADVNSVHTLRFASYSSIGDNDLAAVSEVAPGSTSEALLESVRSGLETNKAPGKTELFDCTGGVYFMKTARGMKAGVFKPSDEEQGMPNNTKGYVDVSLRNHFNPGQGYMREYASYMLDCDNRAQVPETILVQCKHKVFNYPGGFGMHSQPKIGSLQKFVVASDDLFEDFGYGMFSDYEVQKIALFDMRVLNCDRNSANILVVRKQISNRSRNGSCVSDDSPGNSNSSNATTDEERDILSFEDESDESNHEILELIPIDHGYCIPAKLEIHDYDWTWYGYPQVDKPVVPELKQYLASINIEELVADVSNRVNLPEECWFLIRTVHALLVEGIVKANLTIKQVASLIARLDDDIPSALERIISEASENASRTIASRYDKKMARAAKAQVEARKRIWALSAGLGGATISKLQSHPSMEANRSKDSLSSLSTKESMSSLAISDMDTSRSVLQQQQPPPPPLSKSLLSVGQRNLIEVDPSRLHTVASDSSQVFTANTGTSNEGSGSPYTQNIGYQFSPDHLRHLAGPVLGIPGSGISSPLWKKVQFSEYSPGKGTPLLPVAEDDNDDAVSNGNNNFSRFGNAEGIDACNGDDDDDDDDNDVEIPNIDEIDDPLTAPVVAPSTLPGYIQFPRLRMDNIETDMAAEQPLPSYATVAGVNSLAGATIMRIPTINSFSCPNPVNASLFPHSPYPTFSQLAYYNIAKAPTVAVTVNEPSGLQSHHVPIPLTNTDSNLMQEDSLLTSYSEDEQSFTAAIAPVVTFADVEQQYGIAIHPELLPSTSTNNDASLLPAIFNPDDIRDDVEIDQDTSALLKSGIHSHIDWSSVLPASSGQYNQSTDVSPDVITTHSSSSMESLSSVSSNINIQGSYSATNRIATSTKQPFSSPIRLMRVTSFAGFASDSKYDAPAEESNNSKQMLRMQWNNVKSGMSAVTNGITDMWQLKYEFDALMTIFAHQAILTMVSRVLKSTGIS